MAMLAPRRTGSARTSPAGRRPDAQAPDAHAEPPPRNGKALRSWSGEKIGRIEKLGDLRRAEEPFLLDGNDRRQGREETPAGGRDPYDL